MQADPRPEAPAEPPLEACCGSGCDPCIFDVHAQAMERFRERLQAWEALQPPGTRLEP